jgi:hypothetical protein
MSTGPVIWAAVAEGRADDVKNLLRGGGVDIEVTAGPLQCTSLHISAGDGHVLITLYLIDHGALVCALDRDGWTPLHYACFNSRICIILLLIEAGADVNAKDNVGITPLMLLARTGDHFIAELLLYKGADVNAVDGKLLTPLHYASITGNIKMISLFVEYGAVSTTTPDRVTCDSLACSHGHTPKLCSMLNKSTMISRVVTLQTPNVSGLVSGVGSVARALRQMSRLTNIDNPSES